MWDNIEQQNQEAWYDYYERLKKEYEAILDELGEKYHFSFDSYKNDLAGLKSQVNSIDEFIDLAELKAEELWTGEEEYETLREELIEKFEEIRHFIDKELAPELKQFEKEIAKDPSQRTESFKKELSDKGRRKMWEKTKQKLLEMEKSIKKILTPLGTFGKRLIQAFHWLLVRAKVK